MSIKTKKPRTKITLKLTLTLTIDLGLEAADIQISYIFVQGKWAGMVTY